MESQAIRSHSRFAPRFQKLLDGVERESGVPAKYALPAEVVGLGLLIAVLGMYWDIGVHIDQGRDKSLFTIGHSLIVGGIGICVFGAWLSMVIPGPASRGALRIAGRVLPAGGLILLACSAIALTAFPMDDLWHRLFGEDVTLWGPTHMLMIGGASLCALGIIVLMAEAPHSDAPRSRSYSAIVRVRQYLGAGGLLVALSTLQAEFDFGVPQFQMLFQPIMLAVAAGIGLVFACATLGRFGAIGAVLGFLAIRGALALIVGGALDHTMPQFPLYMVSAICIELLALARWRNPLAFGAAGGLAVGTIGFASEWGWTHIFMRHGWTESMLPEALVLSVAAGVAAGVLGARIAAAIGAPFLPALKRGRTATALTAAAGAAIVVALVIPLPRHGDSGVRATVVPFAKSADSAKVRVTFSKPNYSRDAERFQITSWQGDGSKLTALKQISPTTYESIGRVPHGGNWKSMLRVQRGSKLVGAPIYLPREPLTGKPALPLERRSVPLERDTTLLMRESKQGVGGLATPAYVVVLAIAIGWLAALVFALARAEGPPPGGRRSGRIGRRSAAAHPQH